MFPNCKMGTNEEPKKIKNNKITPKKLKRLSYSIKNFGLGPWRATHGDITSHTAATKPPKVSC